MKRILGIGNALVDIMTRIDDEKILDRFSLPKGGMQLVDREKSEALSAGTSGFTRSYTSGGSAANTMHGLGMLGLKPGYIGSVGHDETGNIFEREMQEAGVKTILLRRDDITGTTITLVTPDSERTFATHLGAATGLTAAKIKPSFLEGFDILFIEGYQVINMALVDKLCRLARKRDMEIAIDLASYNVVESNLESFRNIIDNYIDIVLANEEEARALTGLDPEDALEYLAGKCDIAIVKTGSKGSLVRKGNDIARIEAFPAKCIDTTGAGDLYASGFLYGYASGIDIGRCGHLGSLLAGAVIETTGARIAPGKWPAIKRAAGEIIS
jgi:sugar/nucleoside kinase (ribokinase family)